MPRCFERALEGLMPVARAKQDRDVAGRRPPGDARLAIAHDAGRNQARDLVGDGGGLRLEVGSGDQAEGGRLASSEPDSARGTGNSSRSS